MIRPLYHKLGSFSTGLFPALIWQAAAFYRRYEISVRLLLVISRIKVIQAVIALLREWQNYAISLSQAFGNINTSSGKQITLRLKETDIAFFICLVDCQNEIIKMLYPARKKAQKYHMLLSAVKEINSVSPRLKME